MARIIGGRYRFLRKLGDGGFGEVWLAHDLWLRRDVAVKSVFVRNDSDTARRRMFREARIAARLDHPHIVKVYDILEDGPWLIMEYVHLGRDLAKLGKPLPPGRVANLGAQIADALVATHAAGIVHGDVKPHNVLLTEADQAKLTDFGLSQGGRSGLSLSGSGLVHGTPAYMAPEVANGEKPTPASDVFSLGATIFAAVAGTSPYGEASNDMVMIRRAQDHRLLPCEHAGDLAEAIRPLLAADPAARPDAATARQALHHAARRLRPGGESEPLPWPDPPRPPRRWRVPLPATAGAFSSLAAVVTALLLWHPWDGHAPSPVAAATSPIGDQRTVDPCALAKPAALQRFGQTKLSNDYGNFDRCDVIVSPPGSDDIDVELQFQTPDEKPGRPSQIVPAAGNMRIMRMPQQGGECHRTVILPNTYLVDVGAKFQGNGDGPANLCPMADAATAPAVAELRKGILPRRNLPASSLAWFNTCSLLDTRALSSAIGGVAAGDRPGFGDWTCRWSSVNTDLSVNLRYDQGDPPSENKGRHERLSGRDVYVLPGGDGGDSCLASVVNRSFTDINADPAEEVIHLVVNGHRPPAALCSPATALAAEAISNLPRG